MSAIARFKDWTATVSIRTHMMLILLVTNITIILLLSIGAFTLYESIFVEEIATARVDVSRQISERTRQFKTNMYTLSNLIYTNSDFREFALSPSPETFASFQESMDEYAVILANSFDRAGLEFYIVYLSEDGLGYCSRDVPPTYDYMNPKIKLWYKDLISNAGNIIDVVGYKDNTLGMRVFSAARAVVDDAGTIQGYLMVNADERQIYKMYSDVVTDIKSTIYVANQKGDIVSSSNEKIVGFSYFNMSNLTQLFQGNNHMIADIANKRALFTRYYDAESKFTVYEEIPLEYLLMPLEEVRNSTIILSAIALGIAAVLAYLISKKIALPIKKLCSDVKNVENGNLEQTFSTHTYRELNDLSCGMDTMLQQIRLLIENARKEEEEKRKLEIKWLQAQINPHFMYNTLFSIKCMVEMGNKEDASKMLTIFIQLLRGILSNADEMVKIDHQMEWLKEYMALQQYRYESSFDYIIEYEPSAGDCYIPKLLVQPVVENAILHGIDMEGTCGMISVIVRRSKDILIITVEDNGVGMTQEQIQDIFCSQDSLDRPHIGLKNIEERIRLFYGEPWGMEIQSAVGKGTTVTIKVPVVEKP